MELGTFAINAGYAESIVRGLRSSFLIESNYNQMKNCTNLAELKSFLEQETDYAPFLVSEPQNISVGTLRACLKKKLADEFDYISAQAVPPLSTFLHFMKERYMIDNVVNMIEGLKNKVPQKDLLANADPLGLFPEIPNIGVLEGDDYTTLYREVLIDTPVGPYFIRFLESAMETLDDGDNRTIQEIQGVFKEMRSEEIRSSLKKIWLEDFYEFCQKLNPSTVEWMSDLLKFEADFKTIQVVYNSIANSSNTISKSTTRTKVCPALGYLYPDVQKQMISAMTTDALRDFCKGVDTYERILKDSPDPLKKEEFNVDTKTIDDIMYDEEVKKYSLAFDQQSHFASFYAYLKLKEQEIRNIVWYAEMISRKMAKNAAGWKKIIVPFQHLKASV